MTKLSSILLTTCLVATAAIGCQTREIGAAQPSEPTGEIIFSDDFDRAELGNDWRRGSGEGGSGKWRIENGMLHGSDLKNDPLWLQAQLPEDVQISFDAKALSPTGDLKVEVFGDGENHASGYVLIYGGWSNKLDVIARLDEHGDDRKERPSQGAQPNRTYRMVVERQDSELRWFVDGKPFMTYDDDAPLRGPKQAYFAFSDWTAPVAFDNVEVRKLR